MQDAGLCLSPTRRPKLYTEWIIVYCIHFMVTMPCGHLSDYNTYDCSKQSLRLRPDLMWQQNVLRHDRAATTMLAALQSHTCCKLGRTNLAAVSSRDMGACSHVAAISSLMASTSVCTPHAVYHAATSPSCCFDVSNCCVSQDIIRWLPAGCDCANTGAQELERST